MALKQVCGRIPNLESKVHQLGLYDQMLIYALVRYGNKPPLQSILGNEYPVLER